MSAPRSAQLQRAHGQLEAWRTRATAARRLADGLDDRASRRVGPCVQELKDACDRAQNTLLRLEQGRASGDDVRRVLALLWRDLDRLWRAFSRTLDRVAH